MGEKEIIKAIKSHISRQTNNWKFVMGRETLTKETFLKKLDKDKKFREMVVNMVVNLSVDILTKEVSHTERTSSSSPHH